MVSTVSRMLRKLVGDYPRAFWVIALADVFTSSIGHMLVFPFLAFYAVSQFDIGMTQVGVLFTGMAICDLIGATLGGAFSIVTDANRSLLLRSLAAVCSCCLWG